MAYKGEWEPVFRFLADEVEKQTSVRDYLEGEKVVQTFLLAYLNVTDYYLTRSEEEMGKGFADLWLEPFESKYPDLKYAYLIELKYLKRSEFSEENKKAQLTKAEGQLTKYAADERVVRRSGTTLKCLTLVFSGWELKAAEESGGKQNKPETEK
ncbi:PD-(D/E)XK nuclease domain-containing protein [Desulfobacterales bacterium HSG2]|nr:PD-(D/E)XK nuclease domain-containing protein [Desulfobacterales bacterium HSG2]